MIVEKQKKSEILLERDEDNNEEELSRRDLNELFKDGKEEERGLFFTCKAVSCMVFDC